MPYWLITTGPDSEPGINGDHDKAPRSRQPCVNTVGVPSSKRPCDGYRKRRKIASPRCRPRRRVAGICMDPEGNIFGMMQVDTVAK